MKDASATAIYGSRGANGVVIITTKKGKAGKATLTYNGSVSMSKVKNTMDMMNGYDFVNLQKEIMEGNTKEIDGEKVDEFAYYYLKDGITLDDYKRFKSYDWQDEIYRTAISHNHYVGLSGGSDKMDYSASLSYSNQEGVIINSDLSRYQGRFNFNQRINKSIKVNANANFASNVQNGPNPSTAQTSVSNSLMYSVWGYRPVSPSGSDLLAELYDSDVDMSNDYRFNPIRSLKEEYRKYYINNLQLNGYVSYEFIKGLKLKVSGGYTYDARKNDQFNNSNTRYGGPTSTDKVNAQIIRNERLTWLNENTLTYQTNIKKKHFFNSLVGITFQNSDYEYYSLKSTHIPNESLGMAGMADGTLSSSSSLKSSWSMMSYLARLNYNYKSKYYATASFRADGSSKFSKKHRYGYFPSGSLAWNFMEEEFMAPIKKVVGAGKLRVSWGLTGNNRIGEYDYYALLQMLKEKQGDYISNGSIPSGVYPFDNDMSSVGMVPVSLPNEDLKWETTEQWNVGLDLSFFNERLNFTADVYRKTTRDLLLEASLPLVSGYYSATKNIGKVRNDGLELSLSTVNVQTKDFTWTSDFNIAFNKNEVLELAENQLSLTTAARFDQNYNSQPSYIAKVGLPMGMMYGYIYEGTYKYDDFVKSGNSYTLKDNVPYFSSEANTQPGMPKYKDVNGDGIIDTNDRTIIGRGLPIHTGGFTNSFTYKGFDLSVFFQWSYGNDIMNANRLFFENAGGKKDLNQFASYANRWTPENPESDIPAATKSASNNVISSRIIEDGSYLRLKTVTLGYTFPKALIAKAKLSNARVYVAAQNLWTWTSYSGYDPEVSVRNSALTPGLDFSSYPRAFTLSFGVNLGF